MEDEIWKDIEGYEGMYQVSSEGRVKSLERKIITKNKRQLSYCSNIKKNTSDKLGYQVVSLSKNGITKYHYVHRLVAEAFLPNPDNLPVCNHKDENPSNNKSSNLEWCDAKYNQNYGTCRQRIAEKRSKKVYQYSLDGQLIKIWSSTMECGRNGFNQSHVAACCIGERKTHKGFIWSYTPIEAPNA